MQETISEASKATDLKGSLLKAARTPIVLLLLSAVMIGLGACLSSGPEWMIGAEFRVYNEGVVAYGEPPGILPATAWRPPEGPIERAVACFQKAASGSRDKRLKSAALYNLGTIAGREAYTWAQTGTPRVGPAAAVAKLAEAVRVDPTDEDAKYNLEVLEKLLVAAEEEKAGSGPGYAPGHVDKGY